MQDLYVGDIGDFGKYGLLRKLLSYGSTLAVNWYKVTSANKTGQNDGKFIEYLNRPDMYRRYDPELFDGLQSIVLQNCERCIQKIEHSHLLQATFFSESIPKNRESWHQAALEATKSTDFIFLDPDNGLETKRMQKTNSATVKHVKWNELKDYYDRGQSVILYQHRPQMVSKTDCVQGIIEFGKKYIQAKSIDILEFPKYTNRFYCFFTQPHHEAYVKKLCSVMKTEWKGLCNHVESYS